MRESPDAEPAATGRGLIVVRVLTLLMLGCVVWLAAGGAITEAVQRHRADLGGEVRDVGYWTLWAFGAGDLEMTYATWHDRAARTPTEDFDDFVFVKEAHAKDLARIAAVRRYGQVAFGILCLGGLLLLWNLVRPRGRPARLLVVHGLALTTVVAACLTFHLGLRSLYPPLPGDSKSLALPAIVTLSVGALSLVLLVASVRRGQEGSSRGPVTR